MEIKLLLDNNYSKQDIIHIFQKQSLNLFGDEIEELLNLPKGYLSDGDKVKNNILELKT